MIKINKLTKVFRADDVETTALKEVNFTVEPGEFECPKVLSVFNFLK